MAPRDTNGRFGGWLIAILAVFAALVIIGIFTDGFGLYGTEMTPGATVPPDAPS